MSEPTGPVVQAVVLDDDADTRFAISRILGKCGCEVEEAASVEAALAIVKASPIDIIFSDIRIPGEPGGEDLLEIAVASKLNVHIVLMSCAMDAEMRTRLMELGAAECVQKPFYKDVCMQILSELVYPVKKSA